MTSQKAPILLVVNRKGGGRGGWGLRCDTPMFALVATSRPLWHGQSHHFETQNNASP